MENTTEINLIVIEKSKQDANTLIRSLQQTGYTVQHAVATSPESFTDLLGTTQPDLVLLRQDASLPGIEDCFIALKECASSTPLLFLSDDISEAAIGDALSRGASAVVNPTDTTYLSQIAIALVAASTLKREVALGKAYSDQTRTLANKLLESSTEAIARIENGKYVHTNPAFLNLFGFNNAKDVNGTAVQSIIDTKDQKDFTSFLGDFDNECMTMDFGGVNTNGKKIKLTATVSADTLADTAGQLLTFTCESQNEHLENRLDTMRNHDLLTGLANRQHFMSKLEEHIPLDQSDNNEKAVVYVLLDRFKTLRSDIGIASSDMVLCNVGTALENIAGNEDLVSRFGDNAFAILHSTSGTTTTQGFAENVRAKIEALVSDIDGRAITLTCSIGVCVINEHFSSAQDALSRADLACEVARSSGGNQIHTHSSASDEQSDASHEEEWDAIVRKTIDEERLYLVYQPIVRLNGNAGCQYEILLRILDENNEVVLPGTFISMAEKSGMSGEIDRWVIETTMKKLIEFRADGIDASFFIKLSGATLRDHSIPQWISEKQRQHQIKSDSIVFEIPMATACHDHEHVKAFISNMKDLHYRIALEHFNYDKEHLQLLQHLPADILKVDSALVNNLVDNKENQKNIKAVIALARKHKMQSVAERVDDAGNLAFLWQFGIDFIQGNFVQEPTMDPGYDFEEEVA